MADPVVAETYATTAELQAKITADGGAAGILDGTLQELLEQAGAALESYCHRDFFEHEEDLFTVIGRGGESLLLPNYPVIEVTEISVDGTLLTAAELADLHVETYGRVWGRTWTSGARITGEYSWGYADEDRPLAIKKVCLTLASRMYRLRKTRERVAAGVSSERVGEYSVSFEGLEMDRDLALLLRPWKRDRSAA